MDLLFVISISMVNTWADDHTRKDYFTYSSYTYSRYHSIISNKHIKNLVLFLW